MHCQHLVWGTSAVCTFTQLLTATIAVPVETKHHPKHHAFTYY